MRRRLSVIVLICACFTCIGTRELAAQSPSDEDQIRGVLADYVTGWRDGDAERLARVFATDEGRILWLEGAPGEERLRSMTFGEALKQRPPQPEYGRPWSVLGLDVVDGQLAVAKLEIADADVSYVDCLVLQKISGSWLIVTKTFVTR